MPVREGLISHREGPPQSQSTAYLNIGIGECREESTVSTSMGRTRGNPIPVAVPYSNIPAYQEMCAEAAYKGAESTGSGPRSDEPRSDGREQGVGGRGDGESRVGLSALRHFGPGWCALGAALKEIAMIIAPVHARMTLVLRSHRCLRTCWFGRSRGRLLETIGVGSWPYGVEVAETKRWW